MKHEAPRLIKFKKLHRRLGFQKQRETVGLLESLWLFCQINAPRGDVGQFDDETIAAELEFDGDPAELVRHLVETGWLDRCAENRLVVHDWNEHAPRWVHGVASRKGGMIASPTTVDDYSRELQSPTTVDDDSGGSTPTPNLTKPNLTKPNKKKRGPNGPAAVAASRAIEYPDWFESLWNDYPPRNGRKDGKGEALRAARAIGLDESVPTRNRVVEAIRNYATHCQETGTPARNMAGFLRNEFWVGYCDEALDAGFAQSVVDRWFDQGGDE